MMGPMTGTSTPTLVLGDIHGDIVVVDRVLQSCSAELVIQVGDFGVIWGSDHHEKLEALTDVLDRHGSRLWWVDGNHENFALLLAEYGADPDDLEPTEMTRNITYMPRGYVHGFPSGQRAMFFGGAPSVDQDYRTTGQSWWDEERITDDQVERALARRPVHHMFTHDAPRLPPGMTLLPLRPAIQDRCTAGREAIHELMVALKPETLWHGHYHHHYRDSMSGTKIVGLTANEAVYVEL